LLPEKSFSVVDAKNKRFEAGKRKT